MALANPSQEKDSQDNNLILSPSNQHSESHDFSGSHDHTADDDDTLSNFTSISQRSPNKLFRPPHQNIDIKIADYFTREETFKKFTVYVIKGNDAKGLIETSRRYRDFVIIRDLLVKRWPGCCIPSLPSKNIMDNMKAEFIKQRKLGLEAFLHKMAQLPHLHYSSEYQVFLRSVAANLEENMNYLKKELQMYQKVFYEEMILRYTSNFQYLTQVYKQNQALSVQDAAFVIAKFKTFLYKTQGKMKLFKAVTNEVAKAKKNYYQGINILQTQVAAEYEKDVIGEYNENKNPKTVFYNGNDLQMEIKSQKAKQGAENQSMELINSWIHSEMKEIEGLLEAIEQKEKYENLISKAIEKQKSLAQDLQEAIEGRFSLKTLFSSRNKETHINQINQEILQCNSDVEHLKTLIDMIVLVLAYDEIEKFKNNKAERFYEMINLATKNELDNLTHAKDYWSAILINSADS